MLTYGLVWWFWSQVFPRGHSSLQALAYAELLDCSNCLHVRNRRTENIDHHYILHWPNNAEHGEAFTIKNKNISGMLFYVTYIHIITFFWEIHANYTGINTVNLSNKLWTLEKPVVLPVGLKIHFACASKYAHVGLLSPYLGISTVNERWHLMQPVEWWSVRRTYIRHPDAQ